MTTHRQQLLREAAARGKYAPLYRHLAALSMPEWQTTFAELEQILGFRLPDSAYIHRPWWSNQKDGGGHSHALAWLTAGWVTRAVNLEAATLVFAYTGLSNEIPAQQSDSDLDRDFPVYNAGGCLQGTTFSREDIYGAEGR